MQIDEQARHGLHDRLISVLGEEHALTLISHLPPVGWADVATKRDLDHFADQLRAGMHQLRGEVKAETSHLRGEMYRLHAETQASITAQTRTTFFMMLGSNATLVALAFAAARLA
jgi:hypothetical protein